MVDATQSFAFDNREKLPVFGIVGTTFRIFGKAPLVFMAFALVAQLPIIGRLLVTAPVDTKFTVSTAVVLVLNLMILFLLQTSMTYMAVRLYDDRPAPVGDALRLGVRRYFPMLGTTMLVLLAVYGGLILLVVPGVMWACLFAVAAPVCALESVGPITSMKRSAFLTKHTRWRILGVYLLFFAPLMIASGMITFLLSMRGYLLLGQWVSIALQIVWMPLATILSAAIYAELRRLKENVGVARVFD